MSLNNKIQLLVIKDRNYLDVLSSKNKKNILIDENSFIVFYF